VFLPKKKAVGLVFKEFRQSLKFTEDEMCMAMNIDRQTLNELEQGTAYPSIELFFQFCLAKNITAIQGFEIFAKKIRSRNIYYCLLHKITRLDEKSF
jgi:transcriptional regulator with XRE-family HTH domain